MSRSFGTIGTLADCLSGLNVTDNSIFVGEDVRDVWDVFEQQKLLGTGAFGTVYRAKAKGADAKVVAVKQLPKDTVDVQDALAEFKMCAQLSHPHVMRVFCFFDTPGAIYLVSELANGGELNDFLCGHPEMNNEGGIANVTTQVVAALIYMHNTQKVIHHDIKPPNILVTGQKWSRDPTGQTPVVVLGDFGTCQLRSHASGLAPHVSTSGSGSTIPLLGTPEYCAPEVFEGNSDPRTDVYALGVTLFELLAGEKPFNVVWDIFGDGDADEYGEMKDMELPADLTRLKGVTAEGVSLIGRMLSKDIAKRPTAIEVSEDAWFERCASEESYFKAGASMPEEEAKARAERVAKRARMSYFAKALLNTMAARLADEALYREKMIFMRAVEAGGDSTPLSPSGRGHLSSGVSASELRALFASHGEESTRKFDAIVEALDLDGDGTLCFNEWVAATMASSPVASKQAASAVVDLFKKIDEDGDGRIQLDELRHHFGQLPAEHEAELPHFFASLDTNSDGAISFDEFNAFWEATDASCKHRRPATVPVPSFIDSKFTTKVEYLAWRETLGRGLTKGVA